MLQPLLLKGEETAARTTDGVTSTQRKEFCPSHELQVSRLWILTETPSWITTRNLNKELLKTVSKHHHKPHTITPKWCSLSDLWNCWPYRFKVLAQIWPCIPKWRLASSLCSNICRTMEIQAFMWTPGQALTWQSTCILHTISEMQLQCSYRWWHPLPATLNGAPSLGSIELKNVLVVPELKNLLSVGQFTKEKFMQFWLHMLWFCDKGSPKKF